MISDFYQTRIVMKRKREDQAFWVNSMSPSNLDLAARIVLDQYGLSSLQFHALGNQGGFSGVVSWNGCEPACVSTVPPSFSGAISYFSIPKAVGASFTSVGEEADIAPAGVLAFFLTLGWLLLLVRRALRRTRAEARMPRAQRKRRK